MSALLCAAVHVRTADAAAVPDALRTCTQVTDNDQRLSCFDREMAREIAQSDSLLGLTPQQEHRLAVEAAKQSGAPPPAIAPKPQVSGTIARVVRRADGRALITLDNGQVWLQGEAYERFDAQPGETVLVRSGVLGSFYMHAASGADTRVTRQR
jgi:hypothetical protein